MNLPVVEMRALNLPETSDYKLIQDSPSKSIYDVDNEYILSISKEPQNISLILEQLQIIMNLRKLGISILPEIVSVNKSTGSYIYKKIVGEKFEQAHQDNQANDIKEQNSLILAKFLNAFHGITINKNTSFPFDLRYDFYKDVYNYFKERKPNYAKFYKSLIEEKQYLLKLGNVLLHGDLHGHNMIINKDHIIVGIVDWSDMCIGNYEKDFKFVFSFGVDFVKMLVESYNNLSKNKVLFENLYLYNVLEAFQNFHYSLIVPGNPYIKERLKWIEDAIEKFDKYKRFAI